MSFAPFYIVLWWKNSSFNTGAVPNIIKSENQNLILAIHSLKPQSHSHIFVNVSPPNKLLCPPSPWHLRCRHHRNAETGNVVLNTTQSICLAVKCTLIITDCFRMLYAGFNCARLNFMKIGTYFCRCPPPLL